MDLPSCPSCGQSVLDDDASECPFCGASMSAKPAAGKAGLPPAAAKAGATPSPAKPASGKSAAAQTGKDAKAKPVSRAAAGRSTSEPDVDDDNPIAKDKAAASRAIPLNRKPTKGQTHRVVCPMCETVGFTSTKAAGKEVRCANPECLVPTFVAPALETDEAPVAEPSSPQKPLPKGMLIGIAAVLLLAGGGGSLWYFVLRTDPVVIKGPSAEDLAAIAELQKERERALQGVGTKTDDTKKEGGADDTKAEAPQQAAAITPAQLREKALKRIVDASRSNIGNRSKPFCRRLAVEAFAIAGNLAGAQEQLESLQGVGRNLPYFQVTPFVMIAWQQYLQGDADSAAATAQQAWSAAETLPKIGRNGLDASVDLATLLLVLKRDADARSLIQDHLDAGPQGQLSTLLNNADVSRKFDLDTECSRRPLLEWTSPQWVAVASGLALRGESARALAWAKSAPDSQAKAECLTAWAEGLVRYGAGSGQPLDLSVVEAETSQLEPAVAARVFARVAGAQLAAGDASSAEQSLAKAQAALKTIVVPADAAMPSSKELAQTVPVKPGDPIPMRMAAQAAGEIARVQSSLKKIDEAWSSVTAGLQFARGMGPGLTAVDQVRDLVNRQGASAVQSELKTALALDNDDQARTAYNRYVRQLAAFREAAQTRLQLQVSLLRQAAGWGLLDQVSNEVRTRSAQTEATKNDPLLSTTLPVALADLYRAAGSDDKAESIASAAGKAAVRDPGEEIRQASLQFLADGKVKEAAGQIEQFKAEQPGDMEWQSEWLMRLGCRLVNEGKAMESLQFIASFNSPDWREEGFRIVAALAARKGAGKIVDDFATARSLPPTEVVSVYRGLVAGLMALEQSTPNQPTTADTGGIRPASPSTSTAER